MGLSAQCVSSVGPLPPSVVGSAATMTPADIARACDGDDTQLDRLIAEVLPAIRLEITHGLRRRAAARRRDATQDVDDFVQDVLVHLLSQRGRRLRAWDPTRGRSLRNFVRLLARRQLARVLEGFRGNPWEGGAAADDTEVEQRVPAPEQVFDRILSRQQLDRLMERLRARFNDRSQHLFELLYVEQRPVAEVCEVMKMSRPAVDQWNVRLRQLVRKLAAELDREPAPRRGRTR